MILFQSHQQTSISKTHLQQSLSNFKAAIFKRGSTFVHFGHEYSFIGFV